MKNKSVKQKPSKSSAFKFLIFTSIFGSSVAEATCQPLNGHTFGLERSLYLPSRIIVGDDIPIGTVLSKIDTRIGPGTATAFGRCRSPGVLDVTYRSAGPADSNGIIPSNIAGIGFRLKFILDGNTERTIPYYYPLPGTSYTTYSWSTQSKVSIEMIKTGPITQGGTPLVGPYYHLFLNSRNGNQTGSWSVLTMSVRPATGGSIVIPQPCTITNQSINVPLGTVPRTRFSGVGSTYGDRAFDVSLNCTYQANVSIKLDANADSSQAPGVLAINTASGTSASGVGIQILQNNVPVTFGQDKAVGSTPGTGSYSIPFVARYYQTGTSITSGEANGSANFTLTYN